MEDVTETKANNDVIQNNDPILSMTWFLLRSENQIQMFVREKSAELATPPKVFVENNQSVWSLLKMPTVSRNQEKKSGSAT